MNSRNAVAIIIPKVKRPESHKEPHLGGKCRLKLMKKLTVYNRRSEMVRNWILSDIVRTHSQALLEEIPTRIFSYLNQ